MPWCHRRSQLLSFSSDTQSLQCPSGGDQRQRLLAKQNGLLSRTRIFECAVGVGERLQQSPTFDVFAYLGGGSVWDGGAFH